jgi:2-dehydrotetronate isomerase
MPRFAANLGHLFTERPLLERFGAAAAVGFKAVELQFPYDLPAAVVRAEIDRHRLVMLGVNTRLTPETGLAAVPGREHDFDALFSEALDYVTTLGGRAIHCMTGKVKPEQRAEAERTFIANLLRASDRAANRDITLLIEPLNTRDRPDYFLTCAEQAAEILARLDRTNVRMQFDFYHQQIMGGDLITRFGKHLPFIGHVQVAAVPSRAEPDEGEVNYPAILAAVDRAGYTGWIGCEYQPRGRTEAGLAWGRDYGLGAA